MLYRLEIENFFSVRDQQVLDLTIAPNVPDPDGRYAPVFPGAEIRAPKVVAFYGANASGKTNVLRALEFLVEFARNSAQRSVPGFACERFNDPECANRPVIIAAEFGGVMNLSPEVMKQLEAGEAVEFGTYRYEIELAVVDGVIERVEREVMRQRPGGHGKWQRVFERESDGVVKGSRSFSLSGYQHLQNTLKPNVSVLSSFAVFQHPAASIFNSIVQQVYIRSGHTQQGADQGIIEYLNDNPSVLAMLNAELSRIDVGVKGMRVAETPNGLLPMFSHSGLHVEMPWMLESHGTLSFIRMFPVIAATLMNGGMAILDEFDIAIHPLVLPEIVRWFYATSGRNPDDAQMWFSCHSASLLDDLTKEEIVLCEKDSQGRTHVHSLMDVKVRRDDNLYRKYLSGAYGGVPMIG